MFTLTSLFSSGGSSSTTMMIVWIVVLLVFMFIFMIRPQRKEEAKKKEMIARMEVGDTVLTNSGFYGTLIDISDDTVIVEFGNNRNCRIPMQKAAIMQIEKAGEADEDDE